MSLKRQFQSFAAYNTWANRRLYDAAAEVPEADYHRDIGAFFRSLSARSIISPWRMPFG